MISDDFHRNKNNPKWIEGKIICPRLQAVVAISQCCTVAPLRLKNFAWFAVPEMMSGIGCSRCAAGHFL